MKETMGTVGTKEVQGNDTVRATRACLEVEMETNSCSSFPFG